MFLDIWRCEMTKRIAVWSGPRNLSTAMMYSFANRSDCTAIDEPFYATYLSETGLNHPMRREILASQSDDPQRVIQSLNSPKTLQYEKHMTHHMTRNVPRDWVRDLLNVFLIRHPARVIASYHVKRENPTFEDLGFEQQAELFDSFGGIVIDSNDIRNDPDSMMRALCRALDIPFEAAMLNWPAGPKPFDGVWAKHWYGAVHASTGFAGREGPLPEVAKENAPLMECALSIYERLHTKRLVPQD